MEMPLPLAEGVSEAPEWDAAVVRRLEARLANTMRAIIEPEPNEKRVGCSLGSVRHRR